MRQPSCRFRDKVTCILDGIECPFLNNEALARECEQRSASAFDYVPAEAIQRRWNQQFIEVREPEETKPEPAAVRTGAQPPASRDPQRQPQPHTRTRKGKLDIDTEVPIDVFL